MIVLYLKAFHIISVVAWFSGLFYLPRLFVYHSELEPSSDPNFVHYNRFCTMEYKLYSYITTPAAVLTTLLGLVVLFNYLSMGLLTMKSAGWLHTKLLLVFMLWGYHLYCGSLVKKFQNRTNKFGSKFYRWFNEVPTVFLIGIVILTVVKPF